MSESGRRLYLHEVTQSPDTKLRRIIQLKSPEPDHGEDMLARSVIATWAPDDTTVALEFRMENDEDDRGDTMGLFQVCARGHTLGMLAPGTVTLIAAHSAICNAELQNSSATHCCLAWLALQ